MPFYRNFTLFCDLKELLENWSITKIKEKLGLVPPFGQRTLDHQAGTFGGFPMSCFVPPALSSNWPVLLIQLPQLKTDKMWYTNKLTHLQKLKKNTLEVNFQTSMATHFIVKLLTLPKKCICSNIAIALQSHPLLQWIIFSIFHWHLSLQRNVMRHWTPNWHSN